MAQKSIYLEGITLPVYQHHLWDKFPLFAHQYRTLELSLYSKKPYMMAVPTGFGKTYAGLIPSIIDKTHKTFFVFPSNSLVETQYNSVKNRIKEWKLDLNPIKLTGDSLLEFMVERNYKTKGEALYDLLTQYEQNVIFTNIDIMFNIVSMSKFSKKYAKNIAAMIKSSRIIFDEFHFYKNISAVLLGALFQIIKDFTKNISFLSATPSYNTLELINYLSEEKIDCIYHNDLLNIPSNGFKTVVYPTQLYIEEYSENNIEKGYSWLKEQYAENKLGMAIVDSIRDSILLYRKLKDEGLRVYRYDGMIKDKDISQVKNGIIVGTSAIEVGVDKEIDFLFFEARDTTSFLQRFGRVGRHSEGKAYGIIHNEIYNQLEPFAQDKKFSRIEVLNSLTVKEYRFNYLNLYINSDFKRDIISPLLSLYIPDEKISEEAKYLLQKLHIRDGVSVFVLGKRDGKEVLTFYDVLRIIRDYEIKNFYLNDEAKKKIENLSEFEKIKFDYYSNFSPAIVVEIEDFDEPKEQKSYPKFDENGYFFRDVYGYARKVLEISFQLLLKEKLFRKVINNRTIIEENCITLKDYSDKQNVWIWGYASKLFSSVVNDNII